MDLANVLLGSPMLTVTPVQETTTITLLALVCVWYQLPHLLFIML